MNDLGRPVTRAEALEIATRTLEWAEQQRDATTSATTRDTLINEALDYIGGIGIMIGALSQRAEDVADCNRANDLCLQLMNLVMHMRGKGDSK